MSKGIKSFLPLFLWIQGSLLCSNKHSSRFYKLCSSAHCGLEGRIKPLECGTDRQNIRACVGQYKQKPCVRAPLAAPKSSSSLLAQGSTGSVVPDCRAPDAVSPVQPSWDRAQGTASSPCTWRGRARDAGTSPAVLLQQSNSLPLRLHQTCHYGQEQEPNTRRGAKILFLCGWSAV